MDYKTIVKLVNQTPEEKRRQLYAKLAAKLDQPLPKVAKDYQPTLKDFWNLYADAKGVDRVRERRNPNKPLVVAVQQLLRDKPLYSRSIVKINKQIVDALRNGDIATANTLGAFDKPIDLNDQRAIADVFDQIDQLQTDPGSQKPAKPSKT